MSGQRANEAHLPGGRRAQVQASDTQSIGTEPAGSDPAGAVVGSDQPSVPAGPPEPPGAGDDATPSDTTGSELGAGSGAATSQAPPEVSVGPQTIGAAQPIPLDKTATTAVQTALRAENAAIWAYALVAAADPKDVELIGSIVAAHRVRRDATAGMLVAAKQQAPPPAAAYRVPTVGNEAQARQLAIQIESDCCAAWRNVVGSTDNAELRRLAAQVLAESADRLVRWRQVAKANPVTVPFPGER